MNSSSRSDNFVSTLQMRRGVIGLLLLYYVSFALTSKLQHIALFLVNNICLQPLRRDTQSHNPWCLFPCECFVFYRTEHTVHTYRKQDVELFLFTNLDFSSFHFFHFARSELFSSERYKRPLLPVPYISFYSLLPIKTNSPSCQADV